MIGACFLRFAGRECSNTEACGRCRALLKSVAKPVGKPRRKRKALPYTQAQLIQWRAAVLDRDDRQCQHCGATDKLHAHHIVPKAANPLIALDVANGLTVCSACHAKIHEHEPVGKIIAKQSTLD